MSHFQHIFGMLYPLSSSFAKLINMLKQLAWKIFHKLGACSFSLVNLFFCTLEPNVFLRKETLVSTMVKNESNKLYSGEGEGEGERS
jgi:hypothetical protein